MVVALLSFLLFETISNVLHEVGEPTPTAVLFALLTTAVGIGIPLVGVVFGRVRYRALSWSVLIAVACWTTILALILLNR